jgi:predicted transcriptional regulator
MGHFNSSSLTGYILCRESPKSANEVLAHALILLEQKYREDEAWIEDARQKVDEAKAEVDRGEVLPLETVMAQLQDKFRQARENRA